MGVLQQKKGEHFRAALAFVFISIALFSVAFLSEESKITGFATGDSAETEVESSLRVFDNIDSLNSLAKGNYYIDNDGVIYWLDDASKPAIGKVAYIRDVNKNRHIYIDGEGNIGYVIS